MELGDLLIRSCRRIRTAQVAILAIMELGDLPY